MAGGNLRQSGPLAAAGIEAIETMVDRLAEDHRTAKRLAMGLSAVDPTTVDPASVDTNIVRVAVRASGRSATAIAAALERLGVRANASSSDQLRFVTHRHIDEASVDETIVAFEAAWRGA
jgi:threonine aldolase